MPRIRPARLLVVAALAVTVACGSETADDAATIDTGAAAQPGIPESAPAMMPESGPDTTADALWNHLTTAGYATRWEMWPGKSRLYTGGEPHGMLLTTYVNDIAHGGLSNGATMLPAGAIVVKENYTPDSTLAAVTVMYKAPGYDPAHNDWFWLKRLANGTVEASGRVAGCQDCHRQAVTDFIMTAPLGGAPLDD